MGSLVQAPAPLRFSSTTSFWVLESHPPDTTRLGRRARDLLYRRRGVIYSRQHFLAVQARPNLFVVPTTGRPARLCRIELGFQQSERRWIKPLRLRLRLRRNASFDEFVRREETQGLIRAAERHAGMGEMNTGERLVGFRASSRPPAAIRTRPPTRIEGWELKRQPSNRGAKAPLSNALQ